MEWEAVREISVGLCTRYDVSSIDGCDVLFVPQNRAGSGDSLEHKPPFDRVGHDPFSYLISPTPPMPTCAKALGSFLGDGAM